MLILKKSAVCLLLLSVFLTLPWLSCSAALPSAIQIGACIGLSDSLAIYGESQKKGMELAVSEVNAENFLGKGKEIKVLYTDSGVSKDGTAAGYISLFDQGVCGLIGPTLSSQAFSADPLAQERGIPVIAISNTVPGITEMGDFIFRCSLPESSVIDGTVKSAADLFGIKNVGILWGEKEALTVAGHQAFTEAVTRYGLTIQTDETFAAGDSDFKDQLGRIIAANPDAICVAALVKEAVPIVLQAREMGFKGYIIGNNGFNTPEIIKQAGESAEGILVGTAWNPKNQTPKNLDFIAAFEKSYGGQPDQFAAQSYTAVWLYAEAISTANSFESSAIRNSLAGIRNFTTPLGEFSFTEGREPVHPSALQIVEGGKFVILD